jgi:hypothetical protein
MSKIPITIKTPDKGKTVNQILENALDSENGLLLIALKKTDEKLKTFEKQYKQSSEEFFEQYQTGKTDDRNDYIDWAGEYQIFLSIKEKIEALDELTIEYN